jgi:hypothetical protein
MSRRSWVGLVLALLLSVPALAVTTKSIDGGLTADQVAGLLTGTGATISNIKITGSPLSIGSFDEAGALGIPSGVVLSTGDIANASGANTSTSTGADLGGAGSAALDAVVAPFVTHDATVLEFDVVTESPTFTIRYVFASEEYREWVDSEFNDVFAFFVNGTNIALTPGTSKPVTINTINHLRNQGLYRDNETGSETQFDGYTTPLLAVAVVEPGVSHHIRIAIADTSDGYLDSAVFIAQGGISGSQIAPIILPDVNAISVAYGDPGTTVTLPLFYAFESRPPTFSASGVPGATVTFGPMYQKPDGRFYADMKIVIGPDTPPGSYVLTIRSAVGDAESFATIIVVVDCKPPSILGTGQPQTQIVDRGSTATLKVETLGSLPQTYQWFSGYAGMTRNPIAGATGPELKTPAVNDAGAFWVRVANPCGSTDSNTVFAMPR